MKPKVKKPTSKEQQEARALIMAHLGKSRIHFPMGIRRVGNVPGS